ncbi:MAG: hypothetical protein KDA44_15015 [Planctomycetales bacterium]|nr:hypothetical protein [Planctomycetales bacterium]
MTLSSPAVNAGDPTIALAAGEFDQRGAPFVRVFNAPAGDGAGIDMGAYELQSVTIPQVVDTTVDENDGDYSAGDLSLREAIGLANGSLDLFNPDVITFDPAVFSTPQTIVLDGQLPALSGGATIIGSGADLLTVDANYQGRIFEVLVNSTVDISGVRLTRGDAGAGPGGAILNSGVLSLNQVEIADSRTTGSGGAIDSSGPYGSTIQRLTITKSTISGNEAAQGGGVFIRYGSGTIENTTISGNSAGRSGAVSKFGGFGSLTITNSTITGNTADTTGGGIEKRSFSGALVLNNAIVAGNSLSDGAPSNLTGSGNLSGSYNLLGSGATAFGATNLTGIDDPLLGPLANNGGPTRTHALLPGSPALEAGDPSIASSGSEFDQRGLGFFRVSDSDISMPGSRIDIGAYEAQGAPSADFNSDGSVDGRDFLAWQRGLGKANAQRSDGNSDDDDDADASDLAAWQAQFGQSTGMEGIVAESRQAAEETINSSLIDAALAVSWLDDEMDETLAVLIEPVLAEEIAREPQPARFVPVASAPESSEDADRVKDVATAEETPWRIDESLKNAFS